jgi:ActR/RegA family two-component response regulator
MILIIEDDSNKSSQIESFIRLILPESKIVTKKSYQSGLREIINTKYDFIILDMSLPTYDIGPNEIGGPFRAFAGLEILNEMVRKNLKMNVVVVTQFEAFGSGNDIITLPQLKDQLNGYSDIYYGTVFYNATTSTWKEDLEKIILRGEEQCSLS